jgi:EmrB/QacA subfamily drug resistance transporter
MTEAMICAPELDLSHSTSAAPRTRTLSAKTRWIGLFAVLAADLMNLLDSTVVNVAAPSIRAELGGSLTTLQWLAAGYTLALAVGLLVGGRLGDMFGRRRMLMIGISGFLASSVGCAAAWSPEALIGFRVLQGVFGAAMIPQSFGLIRDLFGREVGKAFATLGPVIGLATILGPVVAGLLMNADWFGSGWRMIFLINLPLGAFSMIVGLRVLPALPPTARGVRLDLRGALVAGAGVLMLVYPLVQGRELGWPTWSLVILGASLPTLAAFAWYQHRRSSAGSTPLVELSVFARRSYSSGVAFLVAFFGAIVGFSLTVGLFLQLGLHYSPLQASLTLAASAIGAFIGSAFGGTMVSRLGRNILHFGLALMTLGLAGLYMVFTFVGNQLGSWDLAAPLAVFGIGMGMIFVPLFDIIVGGLEDHEVGSASGLLSSFQQLGASLGVAVLGTVFFSSVGLQADAQTFVDAARPVVLLTIALTVVTFGLGFLLPRKARLST